MGIAPALPFDTLVEAPVEAGAPLPEPFASIFGPWTMPVSDDAVYVYSNFIVSRDGRISFSEPGYYSPVSLAVGNDNDPWLMGLLRARADACLIGDSSVRLEPDHVWAPEFIFPAAAEAWAQLRAQEGLHPEILQVFLSADGDLPADCAALQREGGRVVIATTTRGAATATALVATSRATLHVEVFDGETVDVPALLERLRTGYGVHRLLCEGGPRVYAGFLAAKAVDDEFFTLSPVVVGGCKGDGDRPSVIEGARFMPGEAPVSTLLSLKRAGELMFLRSRYQR